MSSLKLTHLNGADCAIFQVDKANQRLLENNSSSMYTAEASVENKLGGVQGWRDVLVSAGFRFRKASKSLPDSVFFPQKDDKGKLRQCGDILRAMLGKLAICINNEGFPQGVSQGSRFASQIGVKQQATFQREYKTLKNTFNLNCSCHKIPFLHNLFWSKGRGEV